MDGFGACSPTPCEWGSIQGTDFGATVSSPSGASFRADWNFGFARTVLLATLTSRFFPVLVVQEFTTFTDHSGRANYAVTETFVRSRTSVITTRTGVAAAGYPLGDWVHPVGSLLGVWMNTAPGGGNIREIILNQGLFGTLVVRAFGNCVPTLCAWGRITGITFGTSTASVTGGVFLAPYAFGFASKLIDGSLNPAGTQLTVRTYTEFTDHSGRSNYVSTDTFVRS